MEISCEQLWSTYYLERVEFHIPGICKYPTWFNIYDVIVGIICVFDFSD